MTFLDQLKDQQGGPAEAYYHFLRNVSTHRLHCFVEGKNDQSFYRRAIESHFESIKHIFHRCNGQKGVLATRNKIIEWKQFNPNLDAKITCLYFVDRDLTDILEQPIEICDDVFVTQYYSIENYLVSSNLLRIVYEDIFTFSNANPPDLSIFISNFDRQLEKFYNYMFHVMIWIIYLRKTQQEVELNLDKLRLNKFISINENHELVYQIDFNEEQFLHELQQALSVTTPSEFYDNRNTLLELITTQYLPKQIIRGKYEVWFFVQYIENSFKILKNNVQVSYPSPKISIDNIILMLGSKIFPIPSDLSDFLKKHQPKDLS